MRTAGLLVVLLAAAPAASANEAQYHITAGGTNLGWVSALLENEGVTAANAGAIGTYLANAGAHFVALAGLVPKPYPVEGYTGAAEQIGKLAAAIGGMDRKKALAEVSRILHRVRRSLGAYLSARTGRLELATTCDSAMLDVGTQFGRAHFAVHRGNAAILRDATALLRRAIGLGKQAAAALKCPFPDASYAALPILGASPTIPTANASLAPLLEASWAAGGFAAPFPAAAGAAAAPTAAPTAAPLPVARPTDPTGGTTTPAPGPGTWQRIANAGIPGYNREVLDKTTLAACQRRCVQLAWCKSVDWERAVGRCYVQDADQDDAPLKRDYPGHPYDHYYLTGR